jgi:hypothetical protein
MVRVSLCRHRGPRIVCELVIRSQLRATASPISIRLRFSLGFSTKTRYECVLIRVQCRSDQYQGGHFSITPTVPFSVKQNYLPSSNVGLVYSRKSRDELTQSTRPVRSFKPSSYFDNLSITNQSLISKPYRFLNEEGVVSVTGAIVAVYPNYCDLRTRFLNLPMKPQNRFFIGSFVGSR